MASAAYGAQALQLDAAPVLVRSGGVFALAETKRQEIYAAAERVLQEAGVHGLVLQSSENIHPCSVRIETWLPVNDRFLTDRSTAVIEINPKPFHEFELEYSITLTDRTVTKRYSTMNSLNENTLRALIAYQLRKIPKSVMERAISVLTLRTYFWQLRKPKNKVNALATDWLPQIAVWLLVLGILTVAFGIGGLFLIFGIVLLIVASRRPIMVRSGGKPEAEPRTLSQVDSWQAVIPRAGGDVELIRRRFLEALDAPQNGFRSNIERIWHWGLDGKVEREQIVVSLGRALFFCHLYQYESKLYVGWDSHLNAGTWVEQNLGQGKDRASGYLVAIHSVQRGWQRLTEYDVTDVNCLTEWSHTQLVAVLKNYLSERQIDEEIDFKIVRGERQGLTSTTEPGSKAAAAATGWFKKSRDKALGKAA